MKRRIALALTAVALLALTACSPGEPTTIPTSSGTVDIGRSIAFGEADGEELALDACIPADRSAGPFAGVVLIHGGAFQEGSRSNMLDTCKALATSGVAAFAIDYRLAPSTYPAPVEDTITAVDWLREPEQLDRFDLDADSLSLLGSSAGGIIALSAADELGRDGRSVASVVTLSAAGDITADALTLGTPDPALEAVVLGYLGCDTIDDCDVAMAASPRYNVSGLPPTLLVNGSDELIPVQQAETLKSAIEAAGVSVTLDVVDGERHGLQLLNDTTRAEISAFLAENSTP